MIFRETRLSGAYLIEIEPHADSRGFFARTWCRREFAEHHLEAKFVQSSVSVTGASGTIRGLHYQRAPHGEVKLVSCVRGAIFDVIVDLRPGSETFRQWLSIKMTGDSHLTLYVPMQFAHGFQTLEDDTEVSYMVSAFHEPGAATGIRYDDPSLAIEWPRAVTQISTQDRCWPLLASSSIAEAPREADG